MNTFTVLCVYDMMLVLLKWNGKMLMKWLSEQFWGCCSCVCPHLDGRRWNHREHASVCVVNETRDVESRLIRTVSNRSRGCQTLINLRRAASSRTHLVLQAYCLTDVDEINPLGIEIWYRTTRRFSILGGIEAIRSVPKKYRTRYPALD